MLSRKGDFATLGRAGAVRSDALLVVRYRATGLETSRLGLATGRNLGTAVVRNRVRRRLRETFRRLWPDVGPGWDILAIAKPAIVEADAGRIADAARRLLERGGVVRGTGA